MKAPRSMIGYCYAYLLVCYEMHGNLDVKLDLKILNIIREVKNNITSLYEANKLSLGKDACPELLLKFFQIGNVHTSSHRVILVRWLL